MTVRRILEGKGRDVFTIDPAIPVSEAIQMLATRRIGAIVTLNEAGRVAGILSERDIVRLMAQDGAAALDKPVSSAMTTSVTTAHEDMTIDQAMEIMTRGRFRHLPVCEDGRLVGIVSIGDVVKSRIEAAERETEEMRNYIQAV